MRWCSRRSGPAACCCCCCWACLSGTGREPGGAPTDSSEELQPANRKPSAATGASRRPVARIFRYVLAPSTIPSVPLCDFDLLGAVRLDARPVALLDIAAHPHQPILHTPHVDPRGREGALIPFRDRHRERLRPPSPEIHIYGASALADRQHLAFHHAELAGPGLQLGQALRPDHHIIRFAPEAKLAGAGDSLARP